ncbi:MAG: cobamide remodeling phosphodiesterase CbiR [Fervidobacterium sp.]
MKYQKNLQKQHLIGTTSWLIPGTYYENARLVAQLVDFVELLIYTWDEETKELLDKELKSLKKLHEKYGLVYSVHLPVDTLENVKAVLRYFNEDKNGEEGLDKKLPIINYVVHPFNDSDFLEIINSNEKIAVENLSQEVINHHRTVFDIGHHLLGKKVDHSFLENIVEVHVMGVENGKDHKKLNEKTLDEIYKILRNKFHKVDYVCFEVFDLNDLIESLKIWKKYKKL